MVYLAYMPGTTYNFRSKRARHKEPKEVPNSSNTTPSQTDNSNNNTFQFYHGYFSNSNVDPLDVFWHEGMLKYETGTGVFDSGMDPGFLDVLEKHPKNSDRVKNMLSILKRGPISPYISWHPGTPALVPKLLSFHTQGTYPPV